MKRHGRRRVWSWIPVLLMLVAHDIGAAESPERPLFKRPPEDVSPGAQWARAALRERFPELLRAPIDGYVVVSFVFTPDGKVVSAQKRLFAEGTVPSGLDQFAAA